MKKRKEKTVDYYIKVPEALDTRFRNKFYRKRGDLTNRVIEGMKLLLEMKGNGEHKP